MLELAVIICFPAAMSFAACMDLFTMTIPNRVSLFLTISFFAIAPFAGLGTIEMALHVSAGLLMLSVGIAAFSFGWIGGGDAKITAAAALWFGFEHLLEFLIISSLLGGMLTLALLSWRKIPIQSFLLHQNWALRLHDLNTGIPYGIALGSAALIIYPNTIIWMNTALN